MPTRPSSSSRLLSGPSSRLPRQTRRPMASASGPEMRMIETAPPIPVAGAAMLSNVFI